MLIAGNWKMNTDAAEAVALAKATRAEIGNPGQVRVAFCPPAISLYPVSAVLNDSTIGLGAQNMYHEEAGAYTGEVSAQMLLSVGCSYVILGHSERRQYFGETDEGVRLKAAKALVSGLTPIVCVGESLEERDAGQEQVVVKAQVLKALEGLPVRDSDQVVVAYEPVWAIGTGRTASPQQAQEMHAYIRILLTHCFGGGLSEAIQILYGGSMKPGNASELLAEQDVDGGLIGGASLDATAFAAIVHAAQSAG
jgi:triosephosphate isomerase